MRKLTRALSMLLVCCMMFTLLPVKTEALTIDDKTNTVNATMFYPLTGDSGNGAWGFCGLLVDEDNKLHLVLANEHSNDKITPANKPTLYVIFDNPDDSFCIGYDQDQDNMTPIKNELTYEQIENKSFSVQIVDDSNNPVGDPTVVTGKSGSNKAAQSFFFFELGSADLLKKGSFSIGLETKTGGSSDDDGNGKAWDIGSPAWEGVPVEVHYDYGITKTVANDEDEDTIFENTPDERITYTVKIENKSGQSDGGTAILLPVRVDYVYDHLPAGLILDEKDSNNEGYEMKDVDGDGTQDLVLDENVTLTPDGDTRTKSYTVVAKIDPAFKGGVVRNTAVMGGDELVPKEDYADVTINSYFYVHHIYNDGDTRYEPGRHEVEKRVDKVFINENMGRAHYVETDQDTNGDGVVDSDDYAIVADGTGKFNVTEIGGNTADGTHADAESYTAPMWRGDATEWTNELTTYTGLLDNTLYGGTFDSDYKEPTASYPFTNGENGIKFTPTGSEHYYVWEPSNQYLDPKIVAVWHHDPNSDGSTNALVHTIAGYPVAPVDREYYSQFGFKHLSVPTAAQGIYTSLKLTANEHTDTYNTKESVCSENGELGATWGLSGYIGIDKFNNDIFNAAKRPKCAYNNDTWLSTSYDPIKTFTPYWVTMDGVEVSVTKREAWDLGPGTDYRYKMFGSASDNEVVCQTVAAPSNQILAFSAYAENLDNLLPAAPDPADVAVAYDDSKLIYAGKSGNVKAFTMAADLSNFEFDEAWFVVNYEKNGKEKELRVDAEREGDVITAELNLKKLVEGEITITPYWLDGDTESHGSQLILNVEKKMVSVADSTGLLTDDEYVESTVVEVPAETEAAEETTEATEEATEATEEVTEATEAVEESGKKNDKKNNNKKNDKKNNKKDEVAQTEPVEETVVTEPIEETAATEAIEETVETEPTEASEEIVYEEITIVTFVGINRDFASDPVTRDDCVIGSVFQ